MKCINCGYFLNCDRADENKTECEQFIKQERVIHKEGQNG